MAKKFINLPNSDKKDIYEGLSDRLEKRAIILEKDFWICWVLQKLEELNYKMAFKGGTSLSKVYGLIDRFSEDVDITLDYSQFDPFLDITKQISGTKKKAKSEALKDLVENEIEQKIIPHLESKLGIEINNEPFSFSLADRENIIFKYPSSLSTEFDRYLKPEIRIEFGGRNTTLPSNKELIEPFVATELKDLEFPSCKFSILDPKRTFWEKATLIHAECNKGNLFSSPDRKCRHWYDLVCLFRKYESEITSDKELLKSVVEHKSYFFYSPTSKYEDCLTGGFRLLPNDADKEGLKKDFQAMVTEGMFFPPLPDMNDILDSIKIIEDKLNSWLY
jgi:hypothetical protein